MGPIRRIKQRTRSARPIKFRQALQHYARDGIGASAGLRAAPEVYAALAERALYWTGELWSGLQQAAERREALRSAAASVLELVADHFEQPERWPSVDRELWEPARLCVPACFADAATAGDVWLYDEATAHEPCG